MASSTKALSAAAPMREFARSLPMALLNAREGVMSRFRPTLRAHNITEQQWRVIRVLVESEELETTVLARRCLILAPSLSRILQALENRGLIRRATVSADQRRSNIKITAAGRRLYKLIAPDSEAHYAAIAREFGADKMQALYDLLQDLNNSLESDSRS